MGLHKGYVAAINGVAQSHPREMVSKLAVLNWRTALFVGAAGLLLAKLVLTSPAYYLIAIGLACAAGLVLIRNLQLAVLAYLFVAALAFGESPAIQSPRSAYKAGLMPSQLFLAFLAGLWLLRAVFVERVKLVKSALNLPLAALGAVAFISLIANNVLHSTQELLFHQMLITQVAEVGLLCFSICAFFLAANTLGERKWIQRIFVPVVLLGLYFAAHRIFNFRLPIPMMWGTFLLAAAIVFVYARLLFDSLDRWRTIGFILLLLVMLYSAYSRLSWLSGCVAVTMAIMVVSCYRSWRLAVLLTALALMVVLACPGIYHSVREESEMGGDFDRFIIWRDSFHMFMSVNPLLGVGPGNYHPYVYRHSTLWFGSRTYTTAHSNYIQMAAELGLVGLAVFLWVIVAAIIVGIRAARASPPELRWLAVAATATFSGIALASLFGDYLFPSRGNNGIVTFGTSVYVWLLMGAAAAASNLPRERDVEETSHGVKAS